MCKRLVVTVQSNGEVSATVDGESVMVPNTTIKESLNRDETRTVAWEMHCRFLRELGLVVCDQCHDGNSGLQQVLVDDVRIFTFSFQAREKILRSHDRRSDPQRRASGRRRCVA